MNPCPIPGATGTLRPEGACTNGVLLLGEAMGKHEAEDGLPFRPQADAGSVLERAIRRCGFSREQFVLWNVVPTHPPNDYLEGAPYEDGAIAWGLPQLDAIVARFNPRCILALGNVAFRSTTGLNGILEARGYPVPYMRQSRHGQTAVIGTLHPSFLRHGAMDYMSVLMHDLRFAVALASALSCPNFHAEAQSDTYLRSHRPTVNGVAEAGWGASALELGQDKAPSQQATINVSFWSPVLWRQVNYDLSWPLRPGNEPLVPPGYLTAPTELAALEWLNALLDKPDTLIAYDIETPYSHNEEKSDEKRDDSGIISIQFSSRCGTGIFMPWRDPFFPIARRILALPNPKIGANNWRFDDVRLAAAGCEVRGTRHDLRWAWKHFQPDLSAGLQFITAFYAPELGPWKHLDKAMPAFYGIRDCDAVLRCI